MANSSSSFVIFVFLFEPPPPDVEASTLVATGDVEDA
jgi:hypothetical protein